MLKIKVPEHLVLPASSLSALTEQLPRNWETLNSSNDGLQDIYGTRRFCRVTKSAQRVVSALLNSAFCDDRTVR